MSPTGVAVGSTGILSVRYTVFVSGRALLLERSEVVACSSVFLRTSICLDRSVLTITLRAAYKDFVAQRQTFIGASGQSTICRSVKVGTRRETFQTVHHELPGAWPRPTFSATAHHEESCAKTTFLLSFSYYGRIIMTAVRGTTANHCQRRRAEFAKTHRSERSKNKKLSMHVAKLCSRDVSAHACASQIKKIKYM